MHRARKTSVTKCEHRLQVLGRFSAAYQLAKNSFLAILTSQIPSRMFNVWTVAHKSGYYLVIHSVYAISPCMTHACVCYDNRVKINLRNSKSAKIIIRNIITLSIMMII